jgi:sphingolipid delta-4 desaturase
MVVAAYLFGAFVAHALLMVIHESAHGLVFRSRPANLLLGLLCSIPLVIPAGAGVHKYHLLHHEHQGRYDLDGDLPSEWEARIVGTSAIRKLIWLASIPLIMVIRPLRLRTIDVWDPPFVANLALNVTGLAMIFALTGWIGVAYLALSVLFGFGLHPLGGRWIQRHFVFVPGQETYGYSGPLNRVSLNIGFHNEHHDFPSIPWNRLPKLNAVAPEFYEELYDHRSWARVIVDFVKRRDMSLYSRVVR